VTIAGSLGEETFKQAGSNADQTELPALVDYLRGKLMTRAPKLRHSSVLHTHHIKYKSRPNGLAEICATWRRNGFPAYTFISQRQSWQDLMTLKYRGRKPPVHSYGFHVRPLLATREDTRKALKNTTDAHLSTPGTRTLDVLRFEPLLLVHSLRTTVSQSLAAINIS
jgi:hypothetical protein